ncbi:dTDP-4-dehydrorhamnose 3,5-epimerase [Bacillus cytotoxicus]|uniref:dTDP-4-dehydrorhamnose 3,5-epimerase n=2 Tax=Bacillus cytotoxicus TaxID=580165 RepID=A0AAX2CE00_9BACI|nr:MULTISPECIES: dTDP-4-dehydrorhamnose 3,5-epimerase [Bacillus cereus group]ABS21270.1 dTDP-4-dehydrorhamnose 3,5-epimerase [Bacillus cytotoxicus NVH 391-98]AWC27914.1 dTDP-4-dehydrorhamnose 3,5-epimerase [Bacillus cytotoxicus]AWC31962.1 dTDP-4-dehydrorhamnose 3,5-epimerase [Bacillus cytotoxicus]AWC35995.1 dTDP-4-dehydrorhamnose 3,5-epimerase [Bacillus cytotoxicus]AWC40704.1 dTDP-4-dehydrorhamnose 3,5-epimerase [Bacillus cytotoxicus]
MEIVETHFQHALLLQPRLFEDHRGFFTESYNWKEFQKLGVSYSFIQDNLSFSAKAGTVRGLHFQKEPKAQTKLIQVLKGAIYDVIVDLRVSSPTYKEWKGFILSEENHRQLLVPKGFAHGFCTLVPNTLVMYKVDEYYSSDHDDGLYWNDESLAITWPVSEPILSEKDKALPTFDQYHDCFK